MGKAADIFKVEEIKELLETESNYLNSLKNLQSVLDRSEGNIIPQIKNSIDSFIAVSEKLVENLTALKNLELDDDERARLSKERVGLLKLFFIHYNNYAPVFDQTTHLSMKAKGHFADLIKEVYNVDKVGLSGLLIAPIQRGPRYILLLKGALARISKDPSKSLEDNQIEEMDDLLKHCQKEMALANAKMPSYDPGIGEVRSYKFGDYTCSALTYLGLWSTETTKDSVFSEPVKISAHSLLPEADGGFVMLACEKSDIGEIPYDAEAILPDFQ